MRVALAVARALRVWGVSPGNSCRCCSFHTLQASAATSHPVGMQSNAQAREMWPPIPLNAGSTLSLSLRLRWDRGELRRMFYRIAPVHASLIPSSKMGGLENHFGICGFNFVSVLHTAQCLFSSMQFMAYDRQLTTTLIHYLLLFPLHSLSLHAAILYTCILVQTTTFIPLCKKSSHWFGILWPTEPPRINHNYTLKNRGHSKGQPGPQSFHWLDKIPFRLPAGFFKTCMQGRSVSCPFRTHLKGHSCLSG